MFGFLKEKLTRQEFGYRIAYFAHDIIASDAGQSLGMRYDDWDGSYDWSSFLEEKGIPLLTQKLYVRLFTHCSIQATCTQFPEKDEYEITKGAMAGFKNNLDNYDFETTFIALKKVYAGQHDFESLVDKLNNAESQIPFLPNANIGILNAKYLIERFVIPEMENSAAFIDDFRFYSSNVCVTIGTVQRAIEQIFATCKLV